MRKGPKSAKKDQRIEWQSIPESADERQNMICSEFVARAQDAVFLWMNDFFEQHFPDLQQPLFPSLVSSEKDYSLIYPKRLKGLIEAQGYVKLETPLAAKLFVQEAPKVP